jgi:hypothetical protein
VQLCEDNISSYFEHSVVILDVSMTIISRGSMSASKESKGSSNNRMALNLENGTIIQKITAIN